MGDLKKGDIVARKSYGADILFRVIDYKNGVALLKGISYRIQADAPDYDLILQPEYRVREQTTKLTGMVERKTRSIISTNGILKKTNLRAHPKETSSKFIKPGKVLHIDGDEEYLKTCILQYEKLDMEVTGRHITENEQPGSIYKLLQDIKPDILVLTGHDGLLKGEDNYSNINNYRNSKYFIAAVKEARRYENDIDGLIIFAGACQSMYKSIINAGANYASSPNRVLIHALDPVFIARKVAYTNTESLISPVNAINETITGSEGIGGIQTRGKLREGFPVESIII